MTIEEKAKRYDEAIEIAKDYVEKQNPPISALCEIFPELKESEDERIRKALIKGVESCKASGWTNFGNNVDIDVVLAWLKEQGKQKPIDYNKELKKCRENPLYFFDKYVKLEKQKPACSEEDEKIRKALVRFHKSTIDIDGIKGADILAWLEKQGESYTKKDIDDAYMKGICDAKHELEKQGEQKPTVVDFNAKDWYVSKVDGKLHNIYQSVDKIEQKPTSDARYEVKAGDSLSVNGEPFDYEHATITQKDFAPKQEPKKIEDEIEIPFGAKDSELQEETYFIPDGFHAEIDDDKVVIKKGEKSAAWSKDDEAMFQSCTGAIWAADYYLYEDKQDMEAWLKSLKQRIGG